jgi:hypothetical protein
MDELDSPTDGEESEVADEEWAVLDAATDSSPLRYLASPPESPPPVVVATNLQVLPFGGLAWPDFERLCYRLCRRDGDVEECLFYGVAGQAQYGIDIFMWRKDGGYSVVQCKRHKEFTGNDLKKAVDKFLDGRWRDRADKFALATSSDLAGIAEDVKDQVDRLKKLGITFEPWDCSRLSDELKQEPDLVLDFFGRAAVEAFFDPATVARLVNRLDPSELTEYRHALGDLYREVIAVDDPGIIAGTPSTPLRDRFVMPDLVLESVGSGAEAAEAPADTLRDLSTSREEGVVVGLEPRGQGHSLRLAVEARVLADEWFATGDRKLLVGEPGAGKSALLRYLLLDMFEAEPQLESVALRWADAVPVWIPFGYWTHLACKAGGPIGLEECIRSWLGRWSREDLWPLIERAKDDQRLVLIVDGLDEWATEPLGAQAAQQLVVFANTRRCPVVASSRPLGVETLPLARGEWDLGRIAILSDEQRYELVDRWLESWWSSEAATPRETMPETLLAEIDASDRIRQLSRNPLMLSILLYLRAENDELPTDWATVLDHVVRHLIEEHRKRKVYAAGSVPEMPRSEDVRRLVVLLAADLLRRGQESLSHQEALDLLVKILSESGDKLGLGYPEAKASELARALLDSVSTDLGLLVQPRDRSVGFIHRFIQEFLCAEHLLLCSAEARRAAILEHFNDPQWRETISLCLQQLEDEQEVRSLFEDLDSRGLVYGEVVDQLAAAVAFADVNGVSLDFRSALLGRLVERIETGERSAHRLRLVEHVPAALRSPVRTAVLRKLNDWLWGVRKHPMVGDYAALAEWPVDELSGRALWRGILSEEVSVQRVCAAILGDKYSASGDELFRNLVGLAHASNLVGRQAAAIEALGRGWPAGAGLDELINHAMRSGSPELVAAAVGADMRRGNLTERNRDLLLDLAELDHHGFEWPSQAGVLLAEHFAGDSVVLETYLRAVRDPQSRTSVGIPPAVFVLLRGFADEPRVREWAIDEIRTAEYPFLIGQEWPWQLLAAAYQGDHGFVDAVAEWAAKDTSGAHDVQLSSAARVGRSGRLRGRLLRDLRDSYHPSWAAAALVATYDDPEVRDALRALALDADPARSQQIAELIPNIVGPTEAVDRLLALAVDPEVTRLDRVVKGLAGVVRDGRAASADAIDAAIEGVVDREAAENPDRRRTSAEFALFAHFAHVHPVRALAVYRLGEGDVPLQALVYGFRDDIEVRSAVVPRLFPLPAVMRARLTQVLTDVPLSDGEVTALLDGFDADADDTVKLVGATGLATRARRSQVGEDALIDRILAMVRAIGHDHEERRLAGFAGLATLGAVDRIVGLREEHRPDEPVRVQAPLLDRGGAFDRVVAENWGRIRDVLGDDVEDRLSRYGPDSLWQGLFAIAADYGPLRSEALKRIDVSPATPRRGDPDSWARAAAEARFLARVQPGSGRLRDRCLAILEGGLGLSYAEMLPFWQAVEILAAQFADDPAVRDWFHAGLEQERSRIDEVRDRFADGLRWHHFSPAVVAACRVCPQDERLSEFAALIDTANGLSTDDVELLFAVSGPDDFDGLIDRIAGRLAWSGWFADLLLRPAVARLAGDDQLAAEMEARLYASDARPQGTLIRLLSAAGRFSPNVDFIEARRDLLWQTEPRLMSYDPVAGEVRGEDLILRDLGS